MVDINSIHGDKIEFLKSNIAAYEKRIEKIKREKLKAQKILGPNIIDDVYDMRIKTIEDGKQRFENLLKELMENQAM
ncbi:hypothetical protein A9239_08525 [Methanosarcina sp. A14]|uniref:Uncharacterized protein n=1 Tax=Methanosarcina barkeri MS TaxID=1434108 RepID=A0A0E3LN98_METBA|nr:MULTISPECIES: hypothetical protein [Methanosarcina]AKB54396.1 hypothetical protein MSBRM_1398 [Methanosarcina barkeri MS]OED09068.1 hypothetical protein A9239_08525 [Methanosarcina sp. A14]